MLIRGGAYFNVDTKWCGAFEVQHLKILCRPGKNKVSQPILVQSLYCIGTTPLLCTTNQEACFSAMATIG